MQIKILAVDDSATYRFNIERILSDYCVFTACDGVEAMRVLEEQDGISIVLLDLNMPNMNGFQVLEAMRNDARFKKIRTLILTDNDKPENEIMGLRMGATDYIRKPIHMDSLRARIELHAALLQAQHVLEQQLAEQMISFDMIFDQSPIGIVISSAYSPDNNPDQTFETMEKINPMFEKITGRTKEELFNTGWVNITHPDDIEEDLKKLKRLQTGKISVYSNEKRYIRPDGSIVWVHMVVAPLVLSGDQQFRHICLVQDITERKKIEEALNESERSKSVLLANIPGLAYRCSYDRDWTMQYVSEGCYNLTGYRPESLMYNRELSYNDIISPEYREALWMEWEKVIALRLPFKYEYEIITADGGKKWVLEMGQVIYDDDGGVEALEGIVLDISDRKEMENTLIYNSKHDRWTGLYNLEYLGSLLQKDAGKKGGQKAGQKAGQTEKARRALVGINLSAVQLITAKYGFQYTLKLLKKTAEALSQYCTDSCMLFKTYQTSFIFYITDYENKNELVEFGRNIANLLEPLFIKERISGSIGILEIGEDQDETESDILLRRLLIASEKAVSIYGEDFEICFYDEELETLVNRERDIIEALGHIAADENNADENNEDESNADESNAYEYNEDENKNDALYLQYQPIMDLKTGAIIDFEALARLRTEKLGLVPPVEFIPLAEKTKLIVPIGDKVIVQAFRFSKRLKEFGFEDIGVMINISAIQLLESDFTDRLFDLVRELQIDPKMVGFEVTESVFFSDFEYINSIINKMCDAGFHIAIDDFGTGYSSLAREKELKVDCMKIDKYFIDRLLEEDPDKEITSDIISMSHKLGHYTIAEGVEHESQLQYLKQYNCDMIQGYLVSKPLDEDAAIEFLKKYGVRHGD